MLKRHSFVEKTHECLFLLVIFVKNDESKLLYMVYFIQVAKKGRAFMDNRAVLDVITEIKKAVIGKDKQIIRMVTAILAGGHILIDDIPGVGKTTMAVSLSKAMGMTQGRIQFTSDVMPADIVGFNMYNKETGLFELKPGPVMCNVFLADEINRTSPKTQSALLEVMEEFAVTIDGTTLPMPDPFIVIATQNPVGSAGTQPLPESQMDRFMVCFSMGYPKMQDELQIVKNKFVNKNMYQINAVMDAQKLIQHKNEVKEVYVHDSVYDYVGSLINRTRKNDYIELGVSPRGTVALVKMAKAYAYVSGRKYVIPEDVAEVFGDVVRHRIVLSPKARISRVSVDALIDDIIQTTPMPSVREKR